MEINLLDGSLYTNDAATNEFIPCLQLQDVLTEICFTNTDSQMVTIVIEFLLSTFLCLQRIRK